MRKLLPFFDFNQRVLDDLLADASLFQDQDAGVVLAEHVDLAHRLLLQDAAPQEFLVVVVEALGELAVELEL